MKFVALFLIYKFTSVEPQFFGPVGDVQVQSITECDHWNFTGDESILAVDVDLSEDESGTKALNSKVILGTDLDETFKFKLSVSGGYFGISVTLFGGVCENINEIIPGIWMKITDTLGIPNECPIPEGEYTLEDFTLSKDDLDFPTILYGEINLVAKLFKDNKPLLCKKIVILSEPPS